MKRKGKLREATENLITELDEEVEVVDGKISVLEKEKESLLKEKSLLFKKLED
jgi:hypothetical protein